MMYFVIFIFEYLNNSERRRHIHIGMVKIRPLTKSKHYWTIAIKFA